jgi:2'-5' RNA ligase
MMISGALRRPLLFLSTMTTNPGDWQNDATPRCRIESPMSLTPVEHRRLFFGLDARSQSQALVTLQHRLALAGSPVVADNLHLTLLFLGAVDVARLPQLCQLGGQVASQQADFRVVLDQLGLFPQAKVAWIGPSQAPPQLLDLEQALRVGVSALGLPLDERPYRPHLSLYRKARTLPPSAGLCSAGITLPVSGFNLYESGSTPAGVQYHKLASWDFAVTSSSSITGSKVDR